MAARTHITSTINGEETEFLCEPRQSLLEVLRDVLDLHTTDTPSDDVFWPGDADPDKVQLCVSLSLLVHTLTWAP